MSRIAEWYYPTHLYMCMKYTRDVGFFGYSNTRPKRVWDPRPGSHTRISDPGPVSGAQT